MSTSDIRYLHFREYVNNILNPKNGFTVGWIISNEYLEISWSNCNDSDRYNKHIGRRIVVERLQTEKQSHYKIKFSNNDMRTIINNILTPAFFINEIDFGLSGISNTFVINFIKTLVSQGSVGKKNADYRC